MSRYFQWENQSENHHWNPFRAKVWSIFSHLALRNPHSKVPVQKYSPLANPLSSLQASTFNGIIKEKTIIETNPEQKFGSSLATCHCHATLKSPCTKIITYNKSLVKSMSRYFQQENERENHYWNPSRAKIWSIFSHLTMPTNTQKSPYKNTHLQQIPCPVYEPLISIGKSKWKPSLKPIQSKSLEHPWPLGIAPQHSKVPVPKYFPMTNPLSSFGAGTFDAQN